MTFKIPFTVAACFILGQRSKIILRQLYLFILIYLQWKAVRVNLPLWAWYRDCRRVWRTHLPTRDKSSKRLSRWKSIVVDNMSTMASWRCARNREPKILLIGVLYVSRLRCTRRRAITWCLLAPCVHPRAFPTLENPTITRRMESDGSWSYVANKCNF